MRDLTLDAIFSAFDEVFDKLYEESKIRFHRSDDEPTRRIRNDTFYFNYKGPLPAENKVKVDVTRGETVVFALERKPVLGTYDEFSDLPNATSLQVYSFPEIIVEKPLAVTDGARREPRDLYDLWYISNEGHIPHSADLIDGLNRKLASREGLAGDVLAPRLEHVEKTLKQRWNDRLRTQVMSLPDFDGCYRS